MGADKLNLGCGKDIREGYLNVDFASSKKVDLVFDLNIFPWPFKNNLFNEILMKDILEHLDRPEKVLEEAYRISKPRAIIKISVPHFSSYTAYADLTHKRPFSYFSMEYYDINAKKQGDSFESERKIKFKVKKKIRFSRIQEKLGIGKIFNKFPKIYEKALAFIIPAGGLYFELEVVKDK